MTVLTAIRRYLIRPIFLLPFWVCFNLYRGAPLPNVWPIRKQDYGRR